MLTKCFTVLALVFAGAEGGAGGLALGCMVGVCAAVCIWTMDGPVCKACMEACTSFDPSNEVRVCLADQPSETQTRRLETVSPGQSVVTSFANGTKTCTKVRQNKVYNSSSSFRRIHLGDAAIVGEIVGNHNPLAITEFHDVIVQHRGSANAIMYTDTLEIIQAKQLVQGDRMLLEGNFVEVRDVLTYRSPLKMLLVTDDCTIQANGVLVPTACMNPRMLGFDVTDDELANLDEYGPKLITL